MALIQELEIAGLQLNEAYRKVDKVSVDVSSKVVEVLISVYVSEEARKNK